MEKAEKKEDVFYVNQFELVKLRSKNERLKGKMSDEERKVLKDELQMLNGKLENLVKAKKNLDSLIYKLDVGLGWKTKELERIKESGIKKNEDIGRTELEMETSNRLVAGLKNDIAEILVEEKLLTVTQIKIDEEVRGLKEEILRGKKELLDEEERGKEAILTLQSARDMYLSQIRYLKQEIDEVKYQIRIRENRKEKLKGKYDAVLKSLGHGAEEEGNIAGHAHFLVKLAQEKAELKDKSLVLQRKIMKEEKEYEELETALSLMKSSNGEYRLDNTRSKGLDDERVVGLQADLDKRKHFLKHLKDKFKKGLEENEILETQIDENTRELNALKLDLTEGEECLQSLQRILEDVDRKLERAGASANRFKADAKKELGTKMGQYEKD
ncbi:coiled-coil domain-containing protein 39 [Eurytemora carolleeae]|uniref:coiled-coil domain-containing protein 39 n=1 Tax=Eurytemora carolleeae TaxID=1294199 RepID=UPI000C77FF88|nr:coiled-coil domain-containing protein 39 [Eurytemora carolleeae]|eukprot:XP_023326941.1 coiled-coil domain-containing protein 39-like [Eurytemora affinis]